MVRKFGGALWCGGLRLGGGVEFRQEHGIFSCVYNLAFGAAEGLIYMQNHQVVYCSRDGGQVWSEVTAGLPSTFGFPVAAHPAKTGLACVLPMNGDLPGRYPVGSRALVCKTEDGGETWEGKGQGMASAPGGVAFGTSSGSVFLSEDEGENWQEVARHLPTVLSVEFMA